jgi:hypothetical protein
MIYSLICTLRHLLLLREVRTLANIILHILQYYVNSLFAQRGPGLTLIFTTIVQSSRFNRLIPSNSEEGLLGISGRIDSKKRYTNQIPKFREVSPDF